MHLESQDVGALALLCVINNISTDARAGQAGTYNMFMDLLAEHVGSKQIFMDGPELNMLDFAMFLWISGTFPGCVSGQLYHLI